MPFGLTNAPATFQRLMNHAFTEFLRQFLEVFLDDLCVHLSWKEHLECLRKVFMKCHYYRISLNPQKCQFLVKHSVILGHIVSQNGISTDEGKVKLILELPLPRTLKDFNASWWVTYRILQTIHPILCSNCSSLVQISHWIQVDWWMSRILRKVKASSSICSHFKIT